MAVARNVSLHGVWVRQAARSRSLIHVGEPGWHEVFSLGGQENRKKTEGRYTMYPVDSR